MMPVAQSGPGTSVPARAGRSSGPGLNAELRLSAPALFMLPAWPLRRVPRVTNQETQFGSAVGATQGPTADDRDLIRGKRWFLFYKSAFPVVDKLIEILLQPK